MDLNIDFENGKIWRTNEEREYYENRLSLYKMMSGRVNYLDRIVNFTSFLKNPEDQFLLKINNIKDILNDFIVEDNYKQKCILIQINDEYYLKNYNKSNKLRKIEKDEFFKLAKNKIIFKFKTLDINNFGIQTKVLNLKLRITTNNEKHIFFSKNLEHVKFDNTNFKYNSNMTLIPLYLEKIQKYEDILDYNLILKNNEGKNFEITK